MLPQPLFDEAVRRKTFPLTQRLLYFNAAGVGIMPEPALQSIEKFLNRYRETDLDHSPDSFATMQRLREKLARLVCGQEDEIVLLHNTSNGVSLGVHGFPFASGDEVIIFDNEFPSAVFPWRGRPELKLVKVPAPADRPPTPQDVLPYLSPRTRCICISWVSFCTGFRIAPAEFGAFCRQHDLWFILDVMQGLGGLSIDAPATGADIVTGGAAKWLFSPMGTGFAWLSPRIRSLLKPSWTGWLSIHKFPRFNQLLDYDVPWDDSGRRYECGTLPYHDLFAFEASVDFLLGLGMERVESYVLDLGDYMQSRIAVPGGEWLRTGHREMDSGIRFLSLPNPEETYARLKTRGVVCSFREGRLRFSPHVYNTPEEVDRLAGILGEA